MVIPTLDAAASLERTVAALGDAAGEILVADGGSRDDTTGIARRLGLRIVRSGPGRGVQLAAGAEAASGTWLLFLHADTMLSVGWTDAVTTYQRRPDAGDRAAAFRLAFDDPSPAARRVERLANWRARRLGLPYGDQGLLLSRRLYDAVGGFRPLPLMEDVDLVRRIGRGRIELLPATATTSAARYHHDGWWLRPARNLMCLALWYLGTPPRIVRRLYG